MGQARDGEEACRLYEELSPDILMLDLRMPKKDGLQVVTELMSQKAATADHRADPLCES